MLALHRAKVALSANINTSAFNQIFHGGDDMSGREVTGRRLRTEVRYTMLPQGGWYLRVSVEIL